MKAIQQTGYGFFPGGDPRDFTPDEEGTLPEERERWKADCARAEEREGAHYLPGACRHLGPLVLTLAMYGLGTYRYLVTNPMNESWAPRLEPGSRRLPRKLKKRLRSADRLVERPRGRP
jgi:hypothetical protein